MSTFSITVTTPDNMERNCFSRSALETCLDDGEIPICGLCMEFSAVLLGVDGQPGEAGKPRRSNAAFVGVLDAAPTANLEVSGEVGSALVCVDNGIIFTFGSDRHD